MHALYAELDRNGGQLLSIFRGGCEIAISTKEEVEALLDFFDCDLKPSTSLRHFGGSFGCETPEAQKVIMFRWLWLESVVGSLYSKRWTEMQVAVFIRLTKCIE